MPILRRAVAVLFTLLLILVSLTGAAIADGYYYGAGALSSWTEISGARPALVSPAGIDVPASRSVVRIELASEAGRVVVSGLAIGPGGRTSDFSKNFPVEQGEGYSTHRLFVGEMVPEGGFIRALAIELPGAGRIKSVEFCEPSTGELLSLWWSGFWAPEPVGGFTINSVAGPAFGPVSFQTILYDFVIILSAILIIFMIARGVRLTHRRVARAVLISFVAAFFVYTLRMDYNWLAVWRGDLSRNVGADERIKTLYGSYIKDAGGFIDFIGRMKESLPEGASVRPAADPSGPMASIGRYLALPVLTSGRGEYIWSYEGDGVEYDADTGALKKGDKVVAAPVALFARFGGGRVYRAVKGVAR